MNLRIQNINWPENCIAVCLAHDCGLLLLERANRSTDLGACLLVLTRALCPLVLFLSPGNGLRPRSWLNKCGLLAMWFWWSARSAIMLQPYTGMVQGSGRMNSASSSSSPSSLTRKRTGDEDPILWAHEIRPLEVVVRLQVVDLSLNSIMRVEFLKMFS